MELVRLNNIKKNFAGVVALGGVTLSARAGEVLALLGENGAGKSTLMHILSGTYPAGSYEGEIFLDGKLTTFHAPAEAEAAGITIIHQELSTFPHLTVAENMWVGHWPKRLGLVDWEAMRAQARDWLSRVGADIDPRATMGSLSTGSQQLVEIAKAMSRDSRVLILDEPTSSLTPQETRQLFELIDRLRREGRALIYISHKMEEIFRLADQVCVLRDGQSVHQGPLQQTDEKALIALMVGRSLDRLFPPLPERAKWQDAASLLKVENLMAQAGHLQIGPISFELRPGEILGLAGLLGAGRTELLQALMRNQSGKTTLKEQPLKKGGPRTSLASGMALISEDRKRESIFPNRSLDENAAISRLSTKSLFHLLDLGREAALTQSTLEDLRTRFHHLRQPIRSLSGGNQQKVVIGRALQTSPDVILLDEPTRGIDVGAKFEIYQLLFELASQGKGLIVVSSDLPELMALCDRVIVLAHGRVGGTLARAEFNQEKIMEMAIT